MTRSRSLTLTGALFCCSVAIAQPSTDGGNPEPTPETAADLWVQGELDKELTRKVVLSHQAEVRACYEKVLAGFPKLDGKVMLKFAIGADGTVSAASVESASNPELSSCISARVKTWQFPRPRGGGVVTVRYPFTFTLK